MVKTNKRLLFSFLAALIMAGFVFWNAGCKGKVSETSETVEKSQSQPSLQGFSKEEKKFQVALITNGPLSDWGFNYAHDQAVKYAENVLGDKVKVGSLGNVPETGDAERIMRRLIDTGVNLIIAASFGYQDTSVKLAAEFPNVKFLQAWGFKPSANLGTYSSKMYEAWYAVGIVAGRMTKSNKLGIVAAHPVPPMKWQINAYVLGARSVNPKIMASVTFINHWFDPGLAAEASEALIANGCDVVCGVLDNSVAVAQVAQKRGIYLIGHNTDLLDFAPDVCLVGTRWQWGKLYANAVTRMIEGTWKGTDGDLNGGFKEGYVGITAFHTKVPASIQTEVLQVIQKIQNGEIYIYSGPIRDNKGNIVIKSGEKLSHEQVMGIEWLVEGIK